jgi:hypothetical protein
MEAARTEKSPIFSGFTPFRGWFALFTYIKADTRLVTGITPLRSFLEKPGLDTHSSEGA